jgi:hypothetical protein
MMERDVMNTTIENEIQPTFIELGEAGTGSIEVQENQLERLEEFTRRVASGEFHRSTKGVIPCTCIDGRCGGGELMPNAAGGSETLMVADDLTTKDFALDGDSSTCGQYKNMVKFLKDSGYPVGGHTALERHGAPSGCGANDKLPAIYAYIAQNGDTLKGLAVSLLGYEITDEDHALIISNAQARSDFSGGDELLQVLQSEGGRVDMLRGEHTEVMAVINRRKGTTLDRDALEAEFGDGYEAFNDDEWSFEEGARVISHMGGEEEIRRKRIAMLYYNLATAGVLCGPKMRVVILN